MPSTDQNRAGAAAWHLLVGRSLHLLKLSGTLQRGAVDHLTKRSERRRLGRVCPHLRWRGVALWDSIFSFLGNFAAAGSAFGGETEPLTHTVGGKFSKGHWSGKKNKKKTVADPTGWAKFEVLMERFVSLHRHAQTTRRDGARRVCLRLGSSTHALLTRIPPPPHSH